MSRKIVYLFILIIGLFSSIVVFAQTEITPLTSCSGEITSGCYTLLEPLGNIEGITVGSNATGYSGIGGFINFLFQIGIGIAGILGVVMLIIYGFQYMSNEQSIKNFTELKEKITNVILGLLLLLGTFVLLSTINPDLLMIDPRVRGVSLEFDDESGEEPVASDSGVGSFVNQKTSSCPEGVEKVQNIIVCKKISKKLDDMLTAAKLSGINLSGGGFRTLANQINLRNKHCNCGNNNDCIYKKPSSQCRPPTAIPGRSRHESGLAIDFTCDGQSIRAQDNKCFIWMKNNASKYGFFNLPSEPWHWSIDGK